MPKQTADWEAAERVRHIEASLGTQYQWSKADYADFYAYDIAVLLPLAKELLAAADENVKLREYLRHALMCADPVGCESCYGAWKLLATVENKTP